MIRDPTVAAALPQAAGPAETADDGGWPRPAVAWYMVAYGIDNATDGVASIKNRSRTFYDFDSLKRQHVNWLGVIFGL